MSEKSLTQDVYAVNNQSQDVLFYQCKEFPLGVFPPAFREFALAVRASTGVEGVGGAAASVLAAVSAAIGSSLSLEIRPGFVEQCPLWVCVVGRPGTAKSSSVHLALKPLYARQRELRDAFETEMAAYEASCEDYEAAVKEWKKSRSGERPTPPTKPTERRIVLGDFTSEALVQRLKENSRGLIAHADELLEFVGNLGRYSRDTRSGEGLLLKLWSQSPIPVDRLSRDGGYVEHPFLTVVAGAQPETAQELLLARAANGWLDRWLLEFIPGGMRPTPPPREGIPADVSKAYHAAVNRLLDLDRKTIARLTPEAADGWEALWTIWSSPNFSQELESFVAKHELHRARLALVVRAMRYAVGEVSALDEVGADDVDAAETLLRHFAASRLELAGMLELPKDVRKVVEAAQKRGGKLTAREAQMNLKPRRSADEWKEVFSKAWEYGVGYFYDGTFYLGKPVE